MRTGFHSACVVFLAIVSGCPVNRATGPGNSRITDAAIASGPSWTYDAVVGARADDIAVRLCFADRPAKSLRPVVREALANLEGLAIEGRDEALTVRDGVVALEGVRAGECVRWRVDLRALAEKEGVRTASWVGDSVLVRQSMWLLWPTDAPRDTRSTLTLTVPDGMHASVPWPVAKGSRDGSPATYVLDATVSRWLGYNAFGRLDIDRFERKGAEIEIVRLDRPIATDKAGVRRWIIDAVDGAAMVYGHSGPEGREDRYPRDHLQVVVVPVERGDGAVSFGAAARGGGAGVYLLLDSGATADRLPGGWTTVHELLHHGMPFVGDAWMSEGFVSYYTEVVRTRQGHRDEATGWLELWDAFERGKSGGRGMPLQVTSDRMHETFAYQRVYWGGAAIAFDLDITLRLETDGKVGFDDAMKQLRACCGDAVFQYDADALLEILDQWYGKPLFTGTAKRHLEAREFADIGALYAKLGMRWVDGKIAIDPAHPAAKLRAAIMAAR